MNFKKMLIFYHLIKRLINMGMLGGMAGGGDGAAEISMKGPIKVISPI